MLDPETVELLEGRCPSLSEADRWHVDYIFDQNLAFSRTTDPHLRLQLHRAALGYSTIIPSLKLFLENTKYIKPIAQVVKRLLPCNSKGTIRQTMQRYYVAPQDQKFPIQVSENNYEEHKSGNQEYGFWSAYRQIFLFAMRHFYGLSEAHPLGHSRYAKPRKMHDSQELWSRFKKLAFSLGFVLPGHHPFSRPAQNPPEFTVVHTFLTRLRPPELFEYNPSILAQLSSHIASVLAQMKESRITTLVPFLSLDIEEDWSLQKRCGMTDIDTFFSDQKYLFFHNIYCRPNDPRCQSLTSFAVKRDMFLAFFPEFCEDTYMTGTDCPSDDRDQADSALMQIETSSTPQAAPVQGTNMIPEGEEVNMLESSLTTAMVPASSQPQYSSVLETQQLLQPQPHPLNFDPHILESVEPPIGRELCLVQKEHDRPLLQGASNELILQSLLSPAEHDINPIKWQTVDACACHIGITPSLFYTQLCDQVSESPPYTIFFHVSKKEIICLLHSSVDRFPDLLRELGDIWFARVDEGLGKRPMLNSLTVKQVMSMLQQGTSLLFVGNSGDFRSDILLFDIHTGVAEAMAMPHFHEGQKLWEMKSQEMIL